MSYSLILSKISCFATVIYTLKSPKIPPFAPASPHPLTINFCPVWRPDGNLTFFVNVSLSKPVPWQVWHSFSGIFPVPWHLSHSCIPLAIPNNVLCWIFICPEPLHLSHVFVPCPGSAPFPWQVWHCPFLLYFNSFSTPKATSSRVNTKLYLKSSPLCTFGPWLWAWPLPPKKLPKLPKISPKSSKSNPPALPKPCPPKPCPPKPPAPAPPFSNAACPYWS